MYERNRNETFELKLICDNTALCAMKSNLRLTKKRFVVYFVQFNLIQKSLCVYKRGL
jgi:hypothetical protein